MGLFVPIDNSLVVLRRRGVFIETTLHVRDTAIYAKTGGGYVRLKRDGATSVPHITWDVIDLDQNEGRWEVCWQNQFDLVLVRNSPTRSKAA